MNFCSALGILLGLSSSLPAAIALRDGEAFTYKVSWAVIPGAGEIKISARSELPPAVPGLRVTTTTTTRGLAYFLFPFEARADAFFDAKTGRLVSLIESVEQRNKHTAHAVAFDYPTAQALYTDVDPAAPARPLPMPSGEPLDLITSLIQTRAWDLKPGEKRDALVLFNDDFYELTIHAARLEEVTTPLGTFQTMVLEPRMDKTAPKGMFKKGSTVRVWISQDDRRLPVRFEVEFKIGTGVATLTHYQPPTPTKLTAVTLDEKNSRP